MTQVAVIFAAHPDDEVLGCGGTIARHVDAGDQVHIVIAAEGTTSRDDIRDPSARSAEIESLRAAARRAAEILGARSVEFLGLPDNRLDGLERLDLIKRIERVTAEYRPQIVYTHHAGDLNVDHRRLHEAVLVACRPQPGQSVRRLLAFETASSTEWMPPASGPAFAPDVYVDISSCRERKREALGCYAAEMRAWPHARSVPAVEALARWRGASVGLEAAEAFMLMRETWPA